MPRRDPIMEKNLYLSGVCTFPDEQLLWNMKRVVKDLTGSTALCSSKDVEKSLDE